MQHLRRPPQLHLAIHIARRGGRYRRDSSASTGEVTLKTHNPPCGNADPRDVYCASPDYGLGGDRSSLPPRLAVAGSAVVIKQTGAHSPSIHVYYPKSMTPQGNPLWFMAAAPVSRYKTGPRPIPPPQTADCIRLQIA